MDEFKVGEAQPAETPPVEEPVQGEPVADGNVQLQLPHLTIPLTGMSLDVSVGENGDRAIIVGPVLVRFVLPLNGDGARDVARALTGGIEIASGIPPGVQVRR